jgi:predicted Holliday junction resolvase-like endonuclease
MTKFIFILILIFIILTVLKSLIKNISGLKRTEAGIKNKPENIKKTGTEKDRDKITDAKFEEIK